jgi:protein-S-isoprenylcysteine O-methyltransferase Ste14
MYAAWISLISPGVALYLNSWVFVCWVILLHPIWHKLVKREENKMMFAFGKIYVDYAKKTGRFFPKELKI